jgi:hypothetical protein
MAFEVAETDGATSVDVPTLSEIENEEQDRAQERLKEFSEYALNTIREYKTALEQGTGGVIYQVLQRITAEIGSAMMRAREAGKPETEADLMRLQGKIAKEFMNSLPDSVNIIASELGFHQYGKNILEDPKLGESEKAMLIEALMNEANELGIDLTKPPNYGEAFSIIEKQMNDPKVVEEWKRRVAMAENVATLKNEQKEEEGSWAWRGIKWTGGKMLGFAGSILGRAALYTALGGAGAYLLNRFVPGVPPVIRGIMKTVMPKFTEKLTQHFDTAGQFVIDNYRKIKDFFTNLF